MSCFRLYSGITCIDEPVHWYPRIQSWLLLLWN